jgi:predicted DNA-binding protein with PD1-like motif
MAENFLTLKISNNSEIMNSIEKFAEDNQVAYGIFQEGRGKIKEINLISHGLHGSIIGTKSEGLFEVNTISGQIQRIAGNKFKIDLRMTISSSGFTGKEGQLIDGKAAAGGLDLIIQKKDINKIIEA